MIYLIIYWVLTTIISVIYVIKNPRWEDDQKYFTLFDVLCNLFSCALIGWLAVPIGIFFTIKFKRNN
jgi:hypothetical protein